MIALLVVGAWLLAGVFILLLGSRLLRHDLKRGSQTRDSTVPASRLLHDLRPVQDLAVDFFSRSEPWTRLLGLLARAPRPLTTNALVHHAQPMAASGENNAVPAFGIEWAALWLMRITGLVRLDNGCVLLTETGREVHRRINLPSDCPNAGESFRHRHNNSSPRIHKTTSMNKRNIIITAADHEELSRAITAAGRLSGRARAEMSALQAELARAQIVATENTPSDVITMNSRAELLDLETGERMDFTLVFPIEANIEAGKISVLAPLGTAMLGYRVGDEFAWNVPFGLRRLKVAAVRYQPEAARTRAAREANTAGNLSPEGTVIQLPPAA